MLSSLRKWISNNPWQQMAETDRKVFAVCIGAAFIFWLILNLSQEYTIQRDVTLDYLVSPERILVGNMPKDIEVEVTGQGWTLLWESLRPGPLPVTVDARDKSNTRLRRDELQQQIRRNLSSGALSVDYMNFESIPLLTTPLAGKRVPIIPQVTVTPAAGYVIVDSFYLTPDSVTVNASGDALEDVESWSTVELNLSDVTGRRNGELLLAMPQQNVTLSRSETEYTVRAEPYIERSISVPVTVVNAPGEEQYEITPERVSIRVALPQGAFERVSYRDFEVVADVGTLRDGNFSPQIALRITAKPKETVSAYLETPTVTYYNIR